MHHFAKLKYPSRNQVKLFDFFAKFFYTSRNLNYSSRSWTILREASQKSCKIVATTIFFSHKNYFFHISRITLRISRKKMWLRVYLRTFTKNIFFSRNASQNCAKNFAKYILRIMSQSCATFMRKVAQLCEIMRNFATSWKKKLHERSFLQTHSRLR